MIILSAFLIGLLFTCGTYLILQRSLVRILFGFGLLGYGANLLVVSMSGNPLGKAAPVIVDKMVTYVDPLPQALILTAIVIGFGVTAFMVVLWYRLFLNSHSTDAAQIFQETDQ